MLYGRMQLFVSRSICRIFVPRDVNPGGGAPTIQAGTGLGTGFLIDADRVMTCRHVLFPKDKDGKEMPGVKWADMAVEFAEAKSPEVYSVAEVLCEFQQPDCAVFRLNKAPTNKHGHALRPLPAGDLRPPAKLTNELINVLGYSHREGSGDRRLYLAAHGKVKQANAWQMCYEVSTLGGNSGSPVFLGENWTVVGMHSNAGAENLETHKVEYNCGIPMSTLWSKAGKKLYEAAPYTVAPIQPAECVAHNTQPSDAAPAVPPPGTQPPQPACFPPHPELPAHPITAEQPAPAPWTEEELHAYLPSKAELDRWRVKWATIFPKLADELDPKTVFPSLKEAWMLRSPPTIADFFDKQNGRAVYTGPRALVNTLTLVSLLNSITPDVDSVIALNRELVRLFPRMKALVERSKATE